MKRKTRPKKLIALLLAAAIAFSAVGALATTAGATLLSIKTVDANLILEGYTDEQLKAVSVSDILSKLIYKNDEDPDEAVGTIGHSAGDSVEIASDDVIVLKEYGGEYHIVNRSDTIDILDMVNRYSSPYFDLIVGSGKQLDSENIHYVISLAVQKIYSSTETFTFYTEVNGERTELSVRRDSSYYSDYNYNYYYFGLLDSEFWDLISEGKLFMEVTGTLTDLTTGTSVEAQVETSCSYFTKKSENTWNVSGTYETVTFDYKVGGVSVLTKNFSILLQSNSYGMQFSLVNDAGRDVYRTYRSSDEGMALRRATVLYSGYSAASEYILKISSLNNNYENINLKRYVIKAVKGIYSSLEESAAAGDIKEALFNTGYKDIYDKGVDFTIFVQKDDAEEIMVFTLNFSVIESALSTGATLPPTTSTIDPYFNISSVRDENGYALNNFRISSSYDSYYGYGYQTLFVNDENADPANLKLNVTVDPIFNVSDGISGRIVNFDEPQDFTGERVQYKISPKVQDEASSSGRTKNYFVTILTRSENGAQLFVNGPSEREVYFDSYFGQVHDILVANIGNAALTGLTVEWTEAPRNVKLDGYWNIGGEKNDTLAAFTSTYSSSMNNLAKIRLVPDGEGEIGGTLKISADGQEPITIKLIGHAGDPKIVTQSPLPDAVKYVPYSAVIATDKIHDWMKEEFMWYGELPDGLSLNENTGEIYGVPQEAGAYQFTVYGNIRNESTGYHIVSLERVSFELTVLENTDLNVYNKADENYQILTPVGTEQTPGARNYYLETANTDQLFVSNGVYGEFIDLWLNGQKLNRDVDYTVDSGSTRITIKSQTFSKLESGQTNTLAAEFRVDGDLSKDLKKTPQNFIIGKPPVTPTTPSNPGGTTTPGGSGTIGNTGNTETSASANSNEQNSNDNTSDPVQKVIDQIEKLPDTITEADRGSIEAARKAYDALTDEQKKRVENYEDLLDAEQALKDLEPEEDNEEEENYDDDVLSDDEDDEDIENDAESNDGESSDSDVDSVENASDGVTLFGVVIDQNGTPISGLSMELHSTIQNVSTSRDGCYQFDAAEFGEHTLILTNKTTGVSVEKTFTLVESDRVSIQDNVIYAPNRTNVSLSMVFDGKDITFLQPDDPRLVEYDGSVPTGVSLVIFPGLLAAGALIAAAPKRKKRG